MSTVLPDGAFAAAVAMGAPGGCGRDGLRGGARVAAGAARAGGVDEGRRARDGRRAGKQQQGDEGGEQEREAHAPAVIGPGAAGP
jgi:hypothetical protein